MTRSAEIGHGIELPSPQVTGDKFPPFQRVRSKQLPQKPSIDEAIEIGETS